MGKVEVGSSDDPPENEARSKCQERFTEESSVTLALCKDVILRSDYCR